jgi:CubicO group peptidase (beta-lactamase class C family)
MDSVFRIASMTKAVTSVAAMQLVEQGLLGLDTPVAEYIPSFADLQVLEGFDEANGQPRLRTPAAPPTVRQLLSHTAGFGYEIWNPMLQQAVARGAAQSLFAPDDQYLQAPLVFDPGTEWQYGINTDWLGRLVEILRDASLEQVFSDQICEPLGMNDTHFSLPNEKVSRLVAQNDRQADGVLVERPRESPPRISAFRGGDGLYSTAPDYACFLQALLNGGEHNGARILSDQTVAVMGQNQIGNVEVGASYSVDKELSNDFELFPGSVNRFGLGFLINGKPVASGRAAGSLTWAGIHNTYFWIDPSSEVCAVLMTQILPFFDDKVLAILDAFELEIYAGR